MALPTEKLAPQVLAAERRRMLANNVHAVPVTSVADARVVGIVGRAR